MHYVSPLSFGHQQPLGLYAERSGVLVTRHCLPTWLLFHPSVFVVNMGDILVSRSGYQSVSEAGFPWLYQYQPFTCSAFHPAPLSDISPPMVQLATKSTPSNAPLVIPIDMVVLSALVQEMGIQLSVDGKIIIADGHLIIIPSMDLATPMPIPTSMPAPTSTSTSMPSSMPPPPLHCAPGAHYVVFAGRDVGVFANAQHANSLVNGIAYASQKRYATYVDARNEYIQALREQRVFKLPPGGQPVLVTLEAAGYAEQRL